MNICFLKPALIVVVVFFANVSLTNAATLCLWNPKDAAQIGVEVCKAALPKKNAPDASAPCLWDPKDAAKIGVEVCKLDVKINPNCESVCDHSDVIGGKEVCVSSHQKCKKFYLPRKPNSGNDAIGIRG